MATLIWFLPSVFPQVSNKNIFMWKCLLTLPAFIWALISIYYLLFYWRPCHCKWYVTYTVLILFLPTVFQIGFHIIYDSLYHIFITNHIKELKLPIWTSINNYPVNTLFPLISKTLCHIRCIDMVPHQYVSSCVFLNNMLVWKLCHNGYIDMVSPQCFSAGVY